MHPPERYRRARQDAAYHLQLRIDEAVLAEGTATLSGPVVRVFRGPSSLIGGPMTLRVLYVPAGGDRRPPGGIGRVPAESIAAGRILEAYVDVTPSGCEIALGLQALLDAPTDAPRL